MNETKFGKIVKKLYDRINSQDFLESSRMKESDFTRNRKLSFSDLMVFIMSSTKKSLQAALFAFTNSAKYEFGTYTKQAFSKARKKINPSAFLALLKESVELFYEDGDYKLYKGYRVCAIDGTKYNMPNSKEMKEIFGFQESTNQQNQALGSCLYDVLNGIIIDAQLAPVNSSERELAKRHVQELVRISRDKELLLMDRGYPSAALLQFMEQQGVYYLMRSSNEFSIGMKTAGDDCIINHKFSRGKGTVKLRVVRVTLENGETEILLTNIFDKKLTSVDFKELYHLRWNIEEKYDDLKNKLEIENFSGTGYIAVLQEYYATMFLNNVATSIAYDCNEEIQQLCKDKELKYQYKTNISTTISILKFSLIEMFIVKSQRKRERIMQNIYHQLLISVTPIRTNRSYERVKKHKCQKYSQNRRPL